MINDTESILVPFGLGARKDMAPLAFALHVPHPSESKPQLLLELLEVIEFECFQTVEAVDSFRQATLARLIRMHAALQPAQKGWLEQEPASLQPLVASIHGPLWAEVIKCLPVSGSMFLKHLQQGFPLVGPLPPCG